MISKVKYVPVPPAERIPVIEISSMVAFSAYLVRSLLELVFQPSRFQILENGFSSRIWCLHSSR